MRRINIARTIIKALFLLANNPGLFFKYLLVRIKCLLPLTKSSIQKRINGILFEFDFSYDPAIKKMYVGGYEIQIAEVMKKILKKGDTFIDIGASIGYLSAIGAGLVGGTGQVHSFEPLPQHFHKLEKLAMMNPAYKIVVNQCALGEKEAIADIEVSRQNIVWSTMVLGFLSNEAKGEKLKVPVYRLDRYIKEKALDNISLIKIDVEGFEFFVLKGLSSYFENTNHRPAIICEIIPSAYPLMKYTLTQLLEYLKKYNYNAYSLVDTKTKVDITKLKEVTDIIFKSSA